jgi:dihydropyrimidinase
VVIWDPVSQWTVSAGDLHMATDYTPYEGMELTGRPVTVVVGGQVVAHDRRLVDATPAGRHLPAQRLSLTPSLSSRVPLASQEDSAK